MEIGNRAQFIGFLQLFLIDALSSGQRAAVHLISATLHHQRHSSKLTVIVRACICVTFTYIQTFAT